MLNTAAYRAAVSACKLCPMRDNSNRDWNSVLRGSPFGPRFGLGQADRPKLVILGQNPPADAQRSLHGAWMLHYDKPPFVDLKGPHELLVLELVTRLGLTPAEVWATQGVKCATQNNSTPDQKLTKTCAHAHLRYELAALQPETILILGQMTNVSVVQADPRLEMFHPDVFKDEEMEERLIDAIGSSRPGFVSRNGSKVVAPHPSMVGRFLDREDWLTKVVEMVNKARACTLPAFRITLADNPYASK